MSIKDLRTYSSPPRAEDQAARPCPLCGGGSFRPLWGLTGYSFARCRSCSLIQQNPQPLASFVEGRYGADYLKYELANEGGFLNLALMGLADLGLDLGRDQGSFLDFGCATGALLERARSHGWKAMGVEICHESAAYARSERGLDIFEGPLAQAPWPRGSIDLFHSSHVIEHLNEPMEFLAQAREFLRPGGRLVVVSPNAEGLQARVFGPRWRSAINDHLCLFSPKTIGRALRETGLRLEALVTWGGWAKGAKPTWLKPLLDPLSKAWGFGDVMAVLARRPL